MRRFSWPLLVASWFYMCNNDTYDASTENWNQTWLSVQICYLKCIDVSFYGKDEMLKASPLLVSVHFISYIFCLLKGRWKWIQQLKENFQNSGHQWPNAKYKEKKNHQIRRSTTFPIIIQTSTDNFMVANMINILCCNKQIWPLPHLVISFFEFGFALAHNMSTGEFPDICSWNGTWGYEAIR